MNKMSRILLSLAMPIVLLCVWEALGDRSSPIAPPPQTWLASASTMLAMGELQLAILATLKTVVLSTFIAGVAGTVIGAILGARPAISDAVAPTLEFVRSVPPPTIVPVAMLLIGSGDVLGTTVVSLAALWPILLNVLHATRSIHPTLVNAGHTLRISTRSKVMNIYVPSILPSVIAGGRVAVPLAIIVALLVEMLATRPGIGRMLLSAQRDFDAPAVFALLSTVGLIGVSVNWALEWLDQFVSKKLPNMGH
jgi:ABC-type nitrate/sulfonate/bicarbonate transport system permease component